VIRNWVQQRPYNIKLITHYSINDPYTAWRRESFLASAQVYRRASSLATSRTTLMLGEATWNRDWFLCFQMNHVPRITKKLNPSLTWLGTCILDWCHQSSKEAWVGSDMNCCSPTFLNKSNQICLVNTHETSKWLIFFGCWSHSRQCLGCSIPHLANLSTVQHLLCSTSHIKNSTFVGDPGLQNPIG
jgi:hypothetical protein